MKEKTAMHIIAGSDGPTSIWTAKKSRSKRFYLRNYMRKKRYEIQKKKILKNWKGSTHSIEELITYITKRYKAKEIGQDNQIVKESYENYKASLAEKYYPELLGDSFKRFRDINFHDKREMKGFQELCENRRERALSIPEERIPTDYHYYKIGIEGYGEIQVEVDKRNGFFGAGFTAEKGKQRGMNKILKEIYCYYGMSKKDIAEYTERAQSLIAVLTAD